MCKRPVIDFQYYRAGRQNGGAPFTYDDYSAMGGLEDYSGQQMPHGHDSSFDASYTVRGNVTKVTEYKDLSGQTIIHNRKWDIFGSVVKEEMGCSCSQQEVMYQEGNGYFAPVKVMQGTGSGMLETGMEYDYNTGLMTSKTDPRGEVTDYSHDAALRVEEVTYPTTASAEADYDDSALTSTKTLNYSEGGVGKSVTTSSSHDGWGRVISVTAPNGAKVDTTYDAMGRVWKRTNPYTSGQTPVETVSTYDALGRVTVVTLTDGQTIQTSYSGNTVTVTDQVSRKVKREVDGLGRLVKVFEQTSSGGTPTQETAYSYDLMDRLVEVNQGGQLRKYRYDALGRLLYEKIPEQAATINEAGGAWTTKLTWTDYNKVATRTDARGVVTTYSYDDLYRLTEVSYDTSGAPGVAATETVTYTYDNTEDSPTIGLE